jgi:hypothetical protein
MWKADEGAVLRMSGRSSESLRGGLKMMMGGDIAWLFELRVFSPSLLLYGIVCNYWQSVVIVEPHILCPRIFDGL